MSAFGLVVILGVVLTVVAVGAMFWVFFAGSSERKNVSLRGLMPSGNVVPEEVSDEEMLHIEEIKRRTGSSKAAKKSDDIKRKLFRAGFYSPKDYKNFVTKQIVVFCIAVPTVTIVLYIFKPTAMFLFIGVMLGCLIGYMYPLAKLDKAIAAREEDVMYYLPLVIEQVSIGVSSSLDVGPCIGHIVQMAEERDSHNPVTEMFVHVEKLIRSGLNLESALTEVAEANGMTEVKHAFMFLAQCARHGGEVSKQLQELADSVMSQRQVQVEARITALPVKATGPLSVVFAGFFGLIFAGLAVRIMEAFQ